jgi:hypothetical protein
MDAVPTGIAGQAGHAIGMALGRIPAAISALTVTRIIIGTAALRASGEALGGTAATRPTTAVCPTAPGNNQLIFHLPTRAALPYISPHSIWDQNKADGMLMLLPQGST